MLLGYLVSAPHINHEYVKRSKQDKVSRFLIYSLSRWDLWFQSMFEKKNTSEISKLLWKNGWMSNRSEQIGFYWYNVFDVKFGSWSYWKRTKDSVAGYLNFIYINLGIIHFAHTWCDFIRQLLYFLSTHMNTHSWFTNCVDSSIFFQNFKEQLLLYGKQINGKARQVLLIMIIRNSDNLLIW